MELMLAGLARQPRKAVVARVENAVTDWALLHALKLLVKIALPCAVASAIAPFCREAYANMIKRLFFMSLR